MIIISTMRNTLIVVSVNRLVAKVDRLVMDKALYVKIPTTISKTTAIIKAIKPPTI